MRFEYKPGKQTVIDLSDEMEKARTRMFIKRFQKQSQHEMVVNIRGTRDQTLIMEYTWIEPEEKKKDSESKSNKKNQADGAVAPTAYFYG